MYDPADTFLLAGGIIIKQGAGCNFFVTYRTDELKVTAEFSFSYRNCHTGAGIRKADIYGGMVFDKNPTMLIPEEDNSIDIFFRKNTQKDMPEDGS
jgi:hypothetical protein